MNLQHLARQLDQKGWVIGWGPNFAWFEARRLDSTVAYMFELESQTVVAFKDKGAGWEELKILPKL
jgi:hypothetical protein